MLTTPDHADAVTSAPAPAPVGPNPQGFYQDCDPGTGRAGTIYRAEEFNELAGNLRTFLAAAAVSPVKGLVTMLKTALDRLYAGRVSRLTATTTLTADQAGLVTVDATTADVTLTLPPAAALPGGGPTFQIVRLDTSAHDLTIKPATGDTLVNGIAHRDDGTPLVVRSDGVNTWVPLTVGRPVLTKPRTVLVAPSGVAHPADPFGATPFDSLASAFDFLYAFELRPTSATQITITVAAGTYVRTAPILWKHPQGSVVSVVGAGSATTILRFNGSSGLGILTFGIQLSKLKLQGDGTGDPSTTVGLDVYASFTKLLDDVVIENFAAIGLNVEAGATATVAPGPLTVNTCGLAGIQVGPGGYLYALTSSTITITGCGTGGNALAANLLVRHGTAEIGNLQTTGGSRGVYVAGTSAALLIGGNLVVNDSTLTGFAVEVINGILTPIAGTTGKIWQASNTAGTVFHTFYASQYGFINAGNQMAAGNRTLTSPAINTIGNTQAFIVP
jgi:hypothetical protein